MGMVDLYRNLKIRNKIFMLSLSIMAATCAITLAAVQYAIDRYDAKIYDEAAQVLNLSSATVDNELGKIEKLSFQLISDNKLQQSLKNAAALRTEYEKLQFGNDLLTYLLNYAQQEKYISSIEMIDANGEEYVTGKKTDIQNEDEDFLPSVRRASGSSVWVSGRSPNVLMLAREIRNKTNLSLDHLGFVIIRIDMDQLVDSLLDLSASKSFEIVHDGRVVYAAHPGLPFDPAKYEGSGRQGYKLMPISGVTYFIAHQTSQFQKFTYFNLIKYDQIFNASRRIKQALILLYVLLFFAVLYFGRRAAASITRPLEKLSLKMKEVQRGNFRPDLSGEEAMNMDETGLIHRNFRIMLEKINELIVENYAKQLMIRETEYKALQAQINPHFLYNTLESINWMAKIHQQRDISSMAESLGQLLRGIIGNKKPMVAIRDELRLIEHYLTIQGYRFGERLQVRIEADEDAVMGLIPKLTIQPIVENAIQHGLEAVARPCLIRVSVSRQGPRVRVAVTDDGPGMDEGTVRAIAAGTVRSQGNGIGLKNIRERIRLMFGDDYGLALASEPGKGTEAVLTIPYRLEEEHVQRAAGR